MNLNSLINNSNFSITNFTQLENTVRNIVENSKLPYTVDFNDVHHFVWIYILAIVLMAGIFVVKFKLEKIKTYFAVMRNVNAISMPNINDPENADDTEAPV